ncbi:MAG: hypothetical protein L3J09_09645 [Flavobacteriaceae bacterium]|nr:hypothetical protein [Flavobacteriaceae bacterium]
MKRVFYVSFILSLFFIACNDDNDATTEPEVVENYYALKIGNNWKYEYFQRVGQTDEFETMGIIEEVLITETTEIGGETYFVFQSNTTGNDSGSDFPVENGITTRNVRDSLGYLIELDHHILFSNENLEDYLISDQEWGNVYGVLLEGNENITVEAGTFLCNQNKIYTILENTGEIANGRDRIYFSDGEGEIFREYSGVNSILHIWEKRLIEYEIID